MIQVAILVPDSTVMQAIADRRYLFTRMNLFLVDAGAILAYKAQGFDPVHDFIDDHEVQTI